ncbi:MAG: PQQ-binding-like beta-propeller repeat protein [Polyangiaceae bacterium]
MFRQPPAALPILVVAFNSKVFGLHASTGAKIWRHEVGGGVAVRAIVHGGIVLVLGSALVGIDYATGRLLWRTEVDPTLSAGTLVAAGQLVFIADAGEAAAFDAGTGRQLWREGFAGEGLGVVALALPGSAAQGDRSG